MTEPVTTPENDIAEDPTLAELAEKNADPFLSKVWPKLSGVIATMQDIAAKLSKFSPPSQPQLFEYCKSTDDATIVEYRDKIAKLEKAVGELRTEMYSHAKSVLSPETLSEDELSKLRGEFVTGRDIVKGQLDALGTYASAMNLDELATAAKDFTIPRLAMGAAAASGGSVVRNPEVHACREWAKANGITVAEKGRIPEEIWTKYRTANGK